MYNEEWERMRYKHELLFCLPIGRSAQNQGWTMTVAPLNSHLKHTTHALYTFLVITLQPWNKFGGWNLENFLLVTSFSFYMNHRRRPQLVQDNHKVPESQSLKLTSLSSVSIREHESLVPRNSSTITSVSLTEQRQYCWGVSLNIYQNDWFLYWFCVKTKSCRTLEFHAQLPWPTSCKAPQYLHRDSLHHRCLLGMKFQFLWIL